MRILVTRPRHDFEAVAARLTLLGHLPIIAPLLQLRLRTRHVDLNGVQAILATSANGVRAFSAAAGERNLTLYAVGPQTAQTARREGFVTVIDCDGDALALAATVARSADPAKGRLLHAAGAETAGRLSEQLQARGFRVDTVVLYEAAQVDSLPPDASDCLRSDRVDGVLIFSPRTAGSFSTLVIRAGLAPHCKSVAAFCISEAAATALAPLQFARMAIAAKPNQDALLDLIPNAGSHT